MTRWVALLRGVNVGGHRRVPMADVCAGLTAAGFTGVRTYLQSGNAVVDGGPDDEREVAALVRSAVVSTCGVDTDVVVRSAAQLADVVARLPWPERATDPTKLHVLFLDVAPERVEARRVGELEQVLADARQIWVWYGDGAGRSRLAVDVPDAVATARNWRTVQALDQMCRAG